jgi:hypothetical protein
VKEPAEQDSQMESATVLYLPGGQFSQFMLPYVSPVPSLSFAVRVVKEPAEQDSQLESATVLYLPDGQEMHCVAPADTPAPDAPAV